MKQKCMFTLAMALVLVLGFTGTGMAKYVSDTRDETIRAPWDFEHGIDITQNSDLRVYGDTTLGDASTDTLTINSTVSIAAALTTTGDIYLDDGSGASPLIGLYTGDDDYIESMYTSKSGVGVYSVTMSEAGAVFNILTGNLKIGDPTLSITMDGVDFAVEGDAEVDGAFEVDGAVDFDSTLNVDGNFTTTANSTFGNAVTDGVTITGAVQGATPFYLDGATDNAFEVAIAVQDPGADYTFTIPAATGAVILSGGGLAEAAYAISGGISTLVWEGGTVDDYETRLTATNPTEDNLIYMPDGVGEEAAFVVCDAGVPHDAGAVWGSKDNGNGAEGGIVFEGATADGIELTLTCADPTGADVTVTLPNQTGMVFVSPTAQGAANSVYGGTGQIVFEGPTNNDIHTILAVTDPTASSKTITFPNDSGMPVLSTAGANGTANAIYGVTGGIGFEGSGADANDTSLLVANPTGTRTVTIPDQTGTFIMSPAGAVDVTSAVSGVTGGFEFEGATADGSETTLTARDADQANALMLPDASGVIGAFETTNWSVADSTGVTYSIVSDGNGDSDYGGYTITVADTQLIAGDGLRITFAGNVSALNGTSTIRLYIDDAAFVTLTLGAAEDFHGQFVMYLSGTAAEEISGYVTGGTIQDGEYDHDTTNFSDGGTTTVAVQVGNDDITSTDVVTLYYVLTEVF